MWPARPFLGSFAAPVCIFKHMYLARLSNYYDNWVLWVHIHFFLFLMKMISLIIRIAWPYYWMLNQIWKSRCKHISLEKIQKSTIKSFAMRLNTIAWPKKGEEKWSVLTEHWMHFFRSISTLSMNKFHSEVNLIK